MKNSYQHLDILFILINEPVDWDNLFKILAKSSPTSLFKFKFNDCFSSIKSDSLKLFFDNWKGRHPLFLQLWRTSLDLNLRMIEQYKAKRNS